MKTGYSNSGFTIVELMIGIAVLAVLMSAAVPGYQAFVKNNCMTTISTSLVTAFQLARSEAVKRRENISIRAQGVSGVVSWDNGWQVDSGSGTTVLRLFPRDGCDLTTVAESTTEFVYDPTGFIDARATFSICDDRDNNNASSPGREVSVSITGRPHTKYPGGTCP